MYDGAQQRATRNTPSSFSCGTTRTHFSIQCVGLKKCGQDGMQCFHCSPSVPYTQRAQNQTSQAKTNSAGRGRYCAKGHCCGNITAFTHAWTTSPAPSKTRTPPRTPWSGRCPTASQEAWCTGWSARTQAMTSHLGCANTIITPHTTHHTPHTPGQQPPATSPSNQPSSHTQQPHRTAIVVTY